MLGDYISSYFCTVTFQLSFPFFVLSAGMSYFCTIPQWVWGLKKGTIMEEAKRIPYGVSNFVEVVEQTQYYVDKTMYLPLLEEQPSNLFFIRPRRFGKSIFLSMLRAYYDIVQNG